MGRGMIVPDFDKRVPILKCGVDVWVKEALCEVDEWLSDLQIIIDKDDDLYSPLTGEVVCCDELWRVRGIIGMFLENQELEIQKKGKGYE